jgi:hypothetical protein
MKKKFENAELELILVDADIITASPGTAGAQSGNAGGAGSEMGG